MQGKLTSPSVAWSWVQQYPVGPKPASQTSQSQKVELTNLSRLQ